MALCGIRGFTAAPAAKHSRAVSRERREEENNMLKNKLTNKLTLSKTTLRILCANDLKDVVGGTQTTTRTTTDTEPLSDTCVIKICRSDFNCL
jgi:hypothetical protein